MSVRRAPPLTVMLPYTPGLIVRLPPVRVTFVNGGTGVAGQAVEAGQADNAANGSRAAGCVVGVGL
ncbi:hypothetical protein [Parafrankia sp. FMc2]|uniref:hypothetical protein n=1 Tax=Parafrankia sp. FMc2 TaxID=3233196 RepID=UPI0034D6CCC9